MESSIMEKLSDKILQGLPPSLQALSEDVRNLVHEGIKEQLLKLDLIPREEFDTQCALLHRTQAKLLELEQVIAKLEEKFHSLSV